MAKAHTVALSSADVEVEVAPGLGGRILGLHDRRAGREWIWRNPTAAATEPPPGATYDDVWIGGFEELFPNDAPGAVEGLEVPDHGELWSASWTVIERRPELLVMEYATPLSECTVRKAVSVVGPTVGIAYSLEPRRSLPYLFKLHLALAVNESCTIDLPGGDIEQVAPGFGTILGDEDGVPWPGEGRLDVCRPVDAAVNEFVYVKNLPDGWCGATDHRENAKLRLEFDRAVFPYCWLFVSYGGWREHNVVVLEPCTTHPKDLTIAAAAGTTPRLAVGKRVEFMLEVTVGRAS